MGFLEQRLEVTIPFLSTRRGVAPKPRTTTTTTQRQQNYHDFLKQKASFTTFLFVDRLLGVWWTGKKSARYGRLGHLALKLNISEQKPSSISDPD